MIEVESLQGMEGCADDGAVRREAKARVGESSCKCIAIGFLAIAGVIAVAPASGQAPEQTEAPAPSPAPSWSAPVLGEALGRTVYLDDDEESVPAGEEPASASDQRGATVDDDQAGGEAELYRLLAQRPAAAQPADRSLGDGPLHEAVRSGDLHALRRLLGESKRVDEPGAHGRTPLMVAAASCAPCLDLLLAAGADPNLRDHSGNSALFPAAATAAGSVKKLLAAGADPNLRNHVGQTALAPAVHNGSVDVVSVLLRVGASVEAAETCRTRCAPAPFTDAVRNQRFEVAEMLRRSGADPQQRLGSGEELLVDVARQGLEPAVRYLIEQRREGIEHDESASAALLAATEAGHASVVAALAESGASLSAEDAEGASALQIAAENGHWEVVREILAAGVDPSSTGRHKDRNPPLLLAARGGHVEAARLLIAAGASVDAANRYSITPLMAAAYQGQAEIVAQLLEADADPNRANGEGNTALIYASVAPHSVVVEQLLRAKADPNVAVLIDAFGEVTPLMLTAGRGHEDAARSLLEAGADPDYVCDVVGFGRVTALEMARQRGFEAVVEMLESPDS